MSHKMTVLRNATNHDVALRRTLYVWKARNAQTTTPAALTAVTGHLGGKGTSSTAQTTKVRSPSRMVAASPLIVSPFLFTVWLSPLPDYLLRALVSIRYGSIRTIVGGGFPTGNYGATMEA